MNVILDFLFLNLNDQLSCVKKKSEFVKETFVRVVLLCLCRSVTCFDENNAVFTENHS